MTPVGADPCRWCGEAHGPACPLVKALDFMHPDDPTRVTRVEFFAPAEIAKRALDAAPSEDYERLR